MEQCIRERNAENEELVMTREARDAAERQRRREAKAASRASSQMMTPGTQTPLAQSHTPSIRTVSQPAPIDAADAIRYPKIGGTSNAQSSTQGAANNQNVEAGYDEPNENM